MPVDSTHPDYDARAPKWARMRDVIAGQDAVHKAGTKYLPKLTDQTEADYLAYVTRATWFGATSRTVDALHGLMFRKPPTIEAPEGMAEILADITMAGHDAEELSAALAREILEVGRGGVLVDFPPVQEQPRSLGAAQASGLRPFATRYAAEDIINWRVERVANKQALTLLVLAETHEEAKDEYSVETKPQFRVLRLVDGVYTQEVWREGAAGLEMVESFVPQMNGKSMSFISFVIVGPEHVGAEVSDPPLIDMADLNLSHYRSTADLEHGAHFTGLPMLFLAGVQLDDGDSVYIGSQKAITAPDPQADGKYIEFTGQGLGALENLIDRKERQMAALGASMLAENKKGVEASETHEMRLTQETSALADVAQTVSDAMTTVLGWLRDWAGQTGDVRFELSSDYVVTKLTAQELTALFGAWMSGAISKQTLFWNLVQGELIEDGRTFEDEQADIESAGPSPAVAAAQAMAPQDEPADA